MQRSFRILVFGITLMVCTGIAGIVPVLPLVAQHFGIPPAESWKVIASFAFSGLVFVPVAGVLSDRLGRKALLVPALLALAAGGVGCACSSSYAEFLFWRMVQGAGGASLSILYTSIIADTWTGAERIRVMSMNAFVLGMSTAACPALGGALAVLDWRLPFLMPLPGVGLAWLAWRLPLMRPGKGVDLKRYAKAFMRSALQRKTLALLALTLLTFVMMSGPVITCFPLLAKTVFGAGPLESGLLIATSALTAGMGATILPRLCRRYSPRSVLFFSMSAYIAAFLCMGAAPALLWLIPGLLLYGAGQGLNLPLVQTLLVGQAADSERGALMSVNGLLLRLGQNIGPWAFGSLAALHGPATAIVGGCIPALLILCIAALCPLPSLAEGSETRTEPSQRDHG